MSASDRMSRALGADGTVLANQPSSQINRPRESAVGAG